MRHDAAIDHDALPGDEARIVGGEDIADVFAASGLLSNIGWVMPVTIAPGWMQLTVMPCGPSSLASARVRPRIACFEAA
jgi:hypothetical protein